MSTWQPICSVIYQRYNILSTAINPKTDILWETILTLNDPVKCVPVEGKQKCKINLQTIGSETDNWVPVENRKIWLDSQRSG